MIVNVSYRFGVSIVAGVLALSAITCVSFVSPRIERGPRGEDVADQHQFLSAFRLVERSGRIIADTSLADRTWIACFVFSRCNASCPVISKKMKDLQAELADTKVQLVSITVDPAFDTAKVMAEFAERYAASPERWWFLTGDKDEVYHLILDQFKISVSEANLQDRQEGAEAVAHSERLVLLGPGNQILGTYLSTDAKALGRLREDAKRSDRMSVAKTRPWLLRLPLLNASLNATCGALLIMGWISIRARRTQLHAACMISAIVVSSLFLTSYLVYHYYIGSVSFRHDGPIRIVYLTILLSHTILAVLVVPLVAVTVFRAYRKRFADHARIARLTFPVWLYVSITGVIVYLMLYQLPLGSPSS